MAGEVESSGVDERSKGEGIYVVFRGKRGGGGIWIDIR